MRDLNRSICRALVGLLIARAGIATAKESPGYNQAIRPILAAHCFKCHGPDDAARQANLRFDQRDSALAETESGIRPIVPGDPEASELVRRIFADDPELVMPPPEANKPLSDQQKSQLKAWIAAGANYESHWAFVPPVQAPLPAIKKADWPRNAIDHFVLAGLESAGLAPAEEADKYTLVRRLYLDLLGLPPTPEESDAFVNDSSPEAYSTLVDRLLASPHYGERWARRWLDLARYADTNGYEKDRPRSIWPYRDWVIAALNADMPFDQFTIEQLAGDLLPGATLDQRIATGFHRNTMLNEEGGIDPLEFRYYAMVDRVATTGTVWLGLTIGCAQCHTHKYDPIPHRDYYRLMAFLNNADEPEIDLPKPQIKQKRDEIAAQIAAIEEDLPNRFPPPDEIKWHDAAVVGFASEQSRGFELLGDSSIRLTGAAPDQDNCTLQLSINEPELAAIRVEALSDETLPSMGPGRAANGNFVLTKITVAAAPRQNPNEPVNVPLESAMADAAQAGFGPEGALDADPKTGWAVANTISKTQRSATFQFTQPVTLDGPVRLVVRLEQQYGGAHTLGRFRVRVGQRLHDDRPEAVRRKENLDRYFDQWLARESSRAIRWTLLKPVAAASDVPTLTILADNSVLASGDQTKRDVYRLTMANELPRIASIRLEALPDERLPKGGPGRIAYEGPFGDFFLSEITARLGERTLKFNSANGSFAAGGNMASAAIDGDPQTGWSINGGQGSAHAAIFTLAEPLTDASTFEIELLFERYYAAGLGRFRIWASDSHGEVDARIPVDIEDLLLIPKARRSTQDREKLLKYYLSTAPELENERQAIRKLRDEMPAYPTTLVMVERPPEHPRQTHVYKRGEFLQLGEAVSPELPSLFAPLPAAVPHNRLSFARWLVSERNPLVARVTVNRAWATIFGRGIVRTTEDFGYQGEPPSHPELLDWLAVEFIRQGWSMKKLHKKIVTSATYRQSSRVTPEVLEKDPQNKLLGHSPRVRLDAELVRDVVLRASGLLSEKIGGPGVFPPQPPGFTNEGTYGPLDWKVSEGEDRFRRGMYTFSKRTAPYAMLLTFDAASGEACLARREVSNTPLQALTLLNDTVFVEAAQALGRRMAATERPIDERIEQLFRSCTVRPPRSEERELLMAFQRTCRDRLEKKELDAPAIAGTNEGNVLERAAWTLTARAVLNLDETITKE